ncbi:hypothetical protein MSG28_012645 [Choristoneura fumiferana]|uniref:Uncharacterized protein n=1 Tax=Choristoneura fumiferana TaxID=7141 RepID=A0ACC0JHH4_CHOFU|nr:hypothetical protein MSG28_012645 [Choristoneura fumiferana]
MEPAPATTAKICTIISRRLEASQTGVSGHCKVHPKHTTPNNTAITLKYKESIPSTARKQESTMSQRAEVEVEDSKQKTDVFLFREPIVLLAILCLPLSFGITAAIQIVKVKDVTDSTGLYQIWSLSGTAIPELGMYVQAFQIVLMLACLLSACKWPESPYWLASQGRLVDSQEAFLWLRGEEGRKERNLLMEERRTPGPFKLYWISFFIAVATISVSVFTNLGDRFWIRWRIGRPKDIMTENILRSCGGIVIASLVSVLSYFVRRKLLFLLVCGISFILSYTMAIWVHVDSTVEDPSNLWFYFGYCTKTKGKTLLEIQKLYTPELSKANSKEDHDKIVTHI